MKSITRFLKATSRPSVKKSNTQAASPKSHAVSTGDERGASTGGYSPSDAMDKGSTQTGHETRSALKKSSKPVVPEFPATQSGAKKSKRLTKEQANAAFDGSYGSHTADGSKDSKTTTLNFSEPTAKDVREYEVTHLELKEKKEDKEITWHRFDMAHLAQAKNLPVFSSRFDKMMMWPSGHSYTGMFEKNGQPGPIGQLTLPSGEVMTSRWQKGRCYHAENENGELVNPGVAGVDKFETL